MQKLSSQKIAQVLHDAELAIRTVTAERDELAQKLAGATRRREAEKLASVMHGKGINLDRDFESLADELEKSAEQGELPIIQKAVDMMAPNMGLKTASLTNDEHVGAGLSELERFVFGDVG